VAVNVQILLIEDDAPFRRSLENFLRRAGYRFDSCATAREAIQLAATRDYSLVILEYHLPDANGVDLINRLRALQAPIHALILSVYDYDTVAKEFQTDRHALFLKKPFDPGDFEWLLNSLFREQNLVLPNLNRKADPEWPEMLAPIPRLRDSRGVLN